jgi:hypothetical protein
MKAAEKDFVHTAADRVGPFAQSAAEKVGPLAVVAADAIGAAADKVSPIAHSAASRVGPLAQSAAERVGPLAQGAADRIAPLATSTVGLVTPYAKVAAGRVSPYTQSAVGYAQSAAGRVAPLAASARLRGTQVSEDARRKISPVLDDAVGRFAPVVESARGRVTTDLLPRLTDVLGVATTAPVVEEVVVPEKKKSRWLKRLAVIGALGAVIAVVARRFLGNQDADWQAARPSTPYAPPTRPSTDSGTSSTAGAGATAAPTDDVPSADSTSVETVESTAATRTDQPAGSDEVELGPPVEEDFAATEPAPIGLLNVDDSGNVEETVVDEVVFREPVPDLPEGEPVSDTLAADEPAPGERAARFSGEGVYVGHEPPEGYVIKGNERSMKYHMPEAAGYGRTVAEVWFNSEEAAQQAGFVRAQR